MASTYSDLEIIVADNASSDDSLAFMAANYPGIRIIRNTSNEGFAKGYNTVLKEVDAEIFVLLNSDVEVTPGWIEPVVSVLSDASVAACQPKILAFGDKNKFEYAGASGGWIDSLGYPFMRGRIFETCEQDKGQYNDAVSCFWASGAALFIKSKCFHDAGGFDESFFAHQEEIDLCWRLKRMGYKIFVQPASVVYHVGGGTLPKGDSLKTYLNFRNNLVMMHKNLPSSVRWWKISLRLLLNLVAGMKEFMSGDKGYLKAVWKGNRDYLRWRRNNRGLKGSDHSREGYYNGLVIWDYFIRGKKTFSEIVKDK